MKKGEMEEIMRKMDGFQLTLRNEYYDNIKTIEEKNKDLIEALESIMFRFGDMPTDYISEIDKWVIGVCVIALRDAGVSRCGYETNTGKSDEYDILNMYYKMFEDS